jgi:quercetin dioxygenase-like cupin family protein
MANGEEHSLEEAYNRLPNLDQLINDIPKDTIVSRTFHSDDDLRAILFAFAPGQELSEHTSAKPAILHFLNGEAQLTLGEDVSMAQAGTWVHMPAHLPHSIKAETSVLLLLLLLS